MTPAEDLARMLEQVALQQRLRGNLVWVQEGPPGERSSRPHVLSEGRLVRLSDDQMRDLNLQEKKP